VPVSRDQLIADWRKRLAIARDGQGASPHRATWLSRLRVRLYRFLLSLYGDGRWNAPSPVEAGTPTGAPAGVVFDSEGALPLAGKPAKSDGKIRAVLKSVANSQSQPLERGPLTSGLSPDSWMVVASSSAHIRTARLLLFLKLAGILARLSARGGDRLVEVQAEDRAAALRIIERNHDKLHGRERVSPIEGINLLAGIPILVIYAPFVILALVAALNMIFPAAENRRPSGSAMATLFFGGWAACVVLFFLIAIVGRAWPRLLYVQERLNWELRQRVIASRRRATSHDPAEQQLGRR